MSDMPDLPPVLERLLESGDHESVGAYALDSLPADERIAFEVHLRTCEPCQAELQVLREAARILRRAIVPTNAASPSAPVRTAPEPETQATVEPEPVSEADDRRAPDDAEQFAEGEAELSEPATDETPDTVDPVLSQDVAEEPAPELPAIPTTPVPETGIAEEPEQPARRSRPRGRISPGVQPSAESLAAAIPARPSRLPWIVAALGLLFGVGAILAALALAENNGNLEEEIAFQNTQIDELNAQRDAYLQQTTAITWELAPTTLGSPASKAVIFADPGGTSSILSVTGMAPLGADQIYQVWYVEADDTSVKGPVVSVDSTGSGLAQLLPDLSPYKAVAVTIEPASGSEIPSTDPVLQGFFTSQ